MIPIRETVREGGFFEGLDRNTSDVSQPGRNRIEQAGSK